MVFGGREYEIRSDMIRLLPKDGGGEFVDIEELADEIGFVTMTMSEKDYEEKAAKLSSVLQMIRFN